jgi:hypothetical protein
MGGDTYQASTYMTLLIAQSVLALARPWRAGTAAMMPDGRRRLLEEGEIIGRVLTKRLPITLRLGRHGDG